MQPPSTHASLLAAMLGGPGRDRAWHRFYPRYAPLLRAWCSRWGRGLGQADVEDLTQEILLKVFKNLPTFDRERGKFHSWLAVLVHHAVLDFLKARKRRPANQGVGGDGGLAQLADLEDPASSDELAASLEEGLTQDVARVIERVQARASESWPVFVACELEGRPVQEVGRELGKSVGAVYQACKRVKDMLAEESKALRGGDDAPTEEERS